MAEGRIAILGGDKRELYVAGKLASGGYDVALFACDVDDGGDLDNESSVEAAVQGARWIIGPSPGLGAGDTVYAPVYSGSVVLDETLLARSDAAKGGLVLGMASPTLTQTARRLAIPVFETKADRSLAVLNATSVAEAVLCLIVQGTDRLLREYRVLVLGYGATAVAITDYLLALRCPVTVSCRSDVDRARAEQRGATAVAYDARMDEFASTDIVINTVPSVSAISEEVFALLGDAKVIDIASPPGGLDHARASELGFAVTWARGLAGSRAPVSVGEARFAYLERLLRS
ncbi:dipicolinate synthase subunit DpsA [Actinophytocola sp.]|uniref:dipicolinate synthase subunit DpsA n=1 Tax=Actinophytocola sp. TaxID=1872138 RepID=UPI003D6BBFB0